MALGVVILHLDQIAHQFRDLPKIQNESPFYCRLPFDDFPFFNRLSGGEKNGIHPSLCSAPERRA